ncbi:MAG TPA: hypothetical protein DCM05_04550 [Elusimicrobia bacterium]|nr:hypothetical protein [Elusimicrobiota bacterium]
MNIYSEPAGPKRRRQAALLELLQAEPLATQQEIVRALRRKGVRSTQVSVSRDIAELGLAKTGGRYQAPSSSDASLDPRSSLRAMVRSAAPAGPNLVVARCSPGAAPRAALAVDELRLEGIVGTIAGDDTVFVAVASKADGERLLRFFR